MKSVFDQITRDELIGRIKSIDDKSIAQWGKMNVYQMLKHCALAEEMYLGKRYYKRVFLGRIIGKMALKSLLKDETPMQQNAPTSSYFKIKESHGDVISERDKWAVLIQEYEIYNNPDFVHWFFGKMTKDQVGYFAYKHADHHLRQFNA